MDYELPRSELRRHRAQPEEWFDVPPSPGRDEVSRLVPDLLRSLPGEGPYRAAWIAVRGAYHLIAERMAPSVSPAEGPFASAFGVPDPLPMLRRGQGGRVAVLPFAYRALEDYVLRDIQFKVNAHPGQFAFETWDLGDASMLLRRTLGFPHATYPTLPDERPATWVEAEVGAYPILLSPNSPLGMMVGALWELLGDDWFAPREGFSPLSEMGAVRRGRASGFSRTALEQLTHAVNQATESVAYILSGQLPAEPITAVRRSDFPMMWEMRRRWREAVYRYLPIRDVGPGAPGITVGSLRVPPR